MNLEKLKKTASNPIECDCAEVQMHALIHIAECFDILCSVLQDIEDKL